MSLVLLPVLGLVPHFPLNDIQSLSIEKWELGAGETMAPRNAKEWREMDGKKLQTEFKRTNEFGESVTLLKGICRRYPPQYTVRGPSWGDYLFPTVESNDWCGEWKEKEKKEEDTGTG